VAREVADAAGVGLTPVQDMDDAASAARVVAAVWGEDILDPALLWAMTFAGNVAMLARRGPDVVGFVMGFLGTDGGLHLHSHILGVLPEHRSAGVGHALKLAQRAACLERGVDEIRWTYDPLVARNARFNLVKLGTVATRMLPHFYGDMRDAVNRGDRSDRFEVRWRLRSERAERAIRAEAPSPSGGPTLLVAEGPADAPVPVATGEAAVPGSRVAVPRDYHALRAREPGLADRWRSAAAAAFADCFEAGLAGTWFGPDGGYVFDAEGEP
jgi:predicted GNAT superfamily acetyltransferase